MLTFDAPGNSRLDDRRGFGLSCTRAHRGCQGDQTSLRQERPNSIMSFPILFAATMSALHIRYDVPMWLAKGVHSHMTLNTHPVTCEWKTVEDNNLVPQIMHRYFGVDVRRGKNCDLFLIEGVPAACFEMHTKDGEKNRKRWEKVFT